MKLKDVLEKFGDSLFLLTVNGLCEEMPFYEYDSEKESDYWKEYGDKEVIKMDILSSLNGKAELIITVSEK